MSKEAMKMALEALEKERPYLGAMPALTSKAITAIKEALSELEQDDEVLGFNGWGFPIEKPSRPEQEPVAKLFGTLPVYDTPPQRTWVGLTLDEQSDCYEKSGGNLSRFAKGIEAKLKEKNT